MDEVSTCNSCPKMPSKISVHKLWMYIRRLWMAIRSLWMAIRSLQTEILACWMDDFGLLNGPYNDALMVSLEWCHRFRKALGLLSKNCLKSFKWSSDNSLVTLQRVAKEVKKGAQGRSNGYLMTLYWIPNDALRDSLWRSIGFLMTL